MKDLFVALCVATTVRACPWAVRKAAEIEPVFSIASNRFTHRRKETSKGADVGTQSLAA